MNDSKTYLIDIVLKPERCNIFIGEQLNLLVNLDPLIKCLECKKSEKIITRICFKEDKIEIELNSPTLNSRITRFVKNINVDILNEKILNELIKLNYLGYCILDKKKYLHIISQAGRFSNGIKIELSNDILSLYDNDCQSWSRMIWEKKDIHKIKINSHQIKNSIKNYISIESLKIIFPFLFENNPSLKFFFSKKIPMKISTNFKTLGKSKGIFFLAQRDADAYE